LEIFRRRAVTKESKLQVELAGLNYLYPRIYGLGGVMSRLGGGIVPEDLVKPSWRS